MAYNRKNILKKIVDIQNLTLQYTKKGVTQKYVYDEYIKPLYHISQSTFYAYLSINAKAELQKIENSEK